MSSESKGMSDWERKIGKAFVEASEAAKRIIGNVSEEIKETEGYGIPALDLIDTNQELIARLALPGTSKEKIDLCITENSLSVDARAVYLEGRYLQREMNPQGFKREIVLPVAIRSEQAKASYQNGILEVHLPKQVATSSTTVRID